MRCQECYQDDCGGKYECGCECHQGGERDPYEDPDGDLDRDERED